MIDLMSMGFSSLRLVMPNPLANDPFRNITSFSRTWIALAGRAARPSGRAFTSAKKLYAFRHMASQQALISG
jgi:hypothetical protein